MTYRETAELGLRSKYLGVLQSFGFSRFIVFLNIYTLRPRICLSTSISPLLFHLHHHHSPSLHARLRPVSHQIHTRILSAIIYSLSHRTLLFGTTNMIIIRITTTTGTMITIIVGTTLLASPPTLRRLLFCYHSDLSTCASLFLCRAPDFLLTAPPPTPPHFFFANILSHLCLWSLICIRSRRSFDPENGPPVMTYNNRRKYIYIDFQ